MTSDFRVGRGRTRYVGRSKMAKNMGRQYGRSLLDALSYALIKPTHVMSESKFHAESRSILFVVINDIFHCFRSIKVLT